MPSPKNSLYACSDTGRFSISRHQNFNGLRHNFASTLVSNGVDLYTVQKLLTHKDASTTQRYAHLSDKALRDAVSQFDGFMETSADNGTIIDMKRYRAGIEIN